MKKSLILVGMLSIGYAYAQSTDPYEGKVGINTSEPKATLDVKSNATDKTKGILTPQVSGDDLKTMTGNLTADQHGMITFATSGVTTADDATTNVQFPGFHRFNIAGTEKSWVRLEPSGLEKLKSTGGSIGYGWRLIGRKPSQYAPIGAAAVDLTLAHTDAPETADFGASGNFSFAAGRQTKASAYGTIAMGTFSQATKIGAIAIGNNNISSGDYTLALGSDNNSSTYYTTAIGYKNTASANYGVAMGNTNTASGFAAVAMGTTNTASARGTVALGEGNNVSIATATAIGFENTASGEGSIAIGRYNKATHTSSIALGGTNTASGVGSFASGLSSTASGYVSYALGHKNTASASYTMAFGVNANATRYGAIAMGEHANALGDFSVAIGRGTHATGWGNVALGMYNTESTTGTRLFVLGNGINPTNTRSDAFTVLNDARVGIDIDNFETTTSDAKLQVNGKILANSLAGTGNRPVYADENGVLVIGTGTAASTGATTLTGDTGLVCNADNRGKMNFIPSTDNTKSDVFGICMRNKDGNYYWGYMVGGNNPTNGIGAFGSGL